MSWSRRPRQEGPIQSPSHITGSTANPLHRSAGTAPTEQPGLGARLIGFLESRSPVFVVVTGAALIALLGVLDAATGPELRFFVFYWLPIALVSWIAGRRWGLVAVVWSGLAWSLAVRPFGASDGNLNVLVWNLAVNVASFAVLALGVAYIRDLWDRERSMALTDFMTDVPNARAFLATLGSEVSRARRSGTALSLAYLDVDEFKNINDRFGHDAGNDLLRLIAQTICTTVRTSDTVARLGGDEFAILMPESDLAASENALRRVLTALDDTARRGGWPVTFSAGLVSCGKTECTHEELLQGADALMYEVKRAGKNSLRARNLE